MGAKQETRAMPLLFTIFYTSSGDTCSRTSIKLSRDTVAMKNLWCKPNPELAGPT